MIHQHQTRLRWQADGYREECLYCEWAGPWRERAIQAVDDGFAHRHQEQLASEMEMDLQAARDGLNPNR